jgi:cephalosporin hydroxylase
MSVEDDEFDSERQQNISKLGRDSALKGFCQIWQRETAPYKYVYNFSWLGRPIIQFPQDILAMQELIWSVKPDLVIETGIARGGSLIFIASILELNNLCGGPPDAEVIGVDIDIRSHNRQAIEAHPMSRRVTMIQGSSIDPDVIEQVRGRAANKSRVMVFLDSDHTHEHVLAELNAYAPLTAVGSYCVVFDTAIEEMPPTMFSDRSWGPGNSPMTAVRKFLETTDHFTIDHAIADKLLITVAPDGFLRRIKD